MTGRDRADGKDVFRPHPNVREVSRRVARLPLDYFVSRVLDHWTVVGPTGVFVVGRSGDDLVAFLHGQPVEWVLGANPFRKLVVCGKLLIL